VRVVDAESDPPMVAIAWLDLWSHINLKAKSQGMWL
jgi:hypothetical protein